MPQIFSRLKYFDVPLLIVSGLLLLLGLAIQYAVSVSGDTIEIFYRQLIFSVIGVALFLLFAFYNYHRLSKINRVVYLILILSLVFLLVFGVQVRGSARWIELGFFRLQPAELAKVVVGIGLSRWLYLKRGQINSWTSFLTTFFYAAIPAVLIFLEPDLGSAAIVMTVWFGLMLLSPLRKTYIVIFLIAGLLFAGLAWKFALQDYQHKRVEVFLNPDKDPKGKGYNVRQAIIAVGSGEMFGRGLGRGLQSQLKFLPERQTDFIFASASEEIGFIGVTVLLGLYYLLFRRLLRIMKYARDDLAMYLTGGVLFLFLAQVLINIGMNIGLLPVTGIPLPFLTYGGSSLLVTCIALGIVQNVARQSKALRF
ncbi:MAG TPA: rod shape-determining protein RodA [Patescibacteria group bacterium]|jgi:rod shape determining protein RodA|nr:rod shape-determining protein RodA [Patescibacteria group bacterium]